ncbi:double-stranded RNA-binding protein Staufen 2-like protein, partial [Dinothrombium tinctorium]
MGKKTPMCLINELSRFNDIQHQYHLVDETGPSHKKTFTVVLKLGENEEYKASGSSIRKAQHAAAEKALNETKYPHPTPKTPKKGVRGNMPLTPTVELNVLAMKRGEPAVYQVYEPPRPPAATLSPFAPPSATPPIYDFRGMYNQRYHYPRGLYCATVKVGDKEFIGKGKTIQAARHAAAEEALRVLRDLPLPEHRNAKEQIADENIKSPISLVHELALKRNLVVKFEVVSESGPSHMPSFVTRCIVGDIVTESEGNGKKVSKRRAAEKMLEELKKLPPLPQSSESNGKEAIDAKALRRKSYPKKRRNNLIRKNNECNESSTKEKNKSTEQ